jgi:hypothetical protein
MHARLVATLKAARRQRALSREYQAAATENHAPLMTRARHRALLVTLAQPQAAPVRPLPAQARPRATEAQLQAALPHAVWGQ